MDDRITPGEPDHTAIDEALKNIFSDPRWRQRYVSERHRYAEIAGIKVGVVFATNSKPRYNSFALNYAHFERLRTGRTAGRVDQMFVVATKTNGAGEFEYCGYAEAEAFYENKLRHQTPRNGVFGPFWSLSPNEFEVGEAPF